MKKHLKQLQKFDQRVEKGIPEVDAMSRHLSKIRNHSMHLSDDVFERLRQDIVDRNKRKNMLNSKRTQE